MLHNLLEIIKSASLAGVAINVTPSSEGELSIVFTPKLSGLTNKAHSELLAKGNFEAECAFNLRKALSSPWVLTGTPESIEVQLETFLQTAGTAISEGNESMNSSGFVKALNSAVTELAKESATPKAVTKASSPAKANEVMKDVEAEVKEPDNEFNLYNDFDEISSI